MKAKIVSMLTIKGIVLNWKQIIIVYGVMPLSICFVLGHFFKDVYDSASNFDKVNITIVDNDKSEESKDFKNLFKGKETGQIFNVSSKGDYIITVNKGYGENLKKYKSVEITVDEKKHISDYNEKLIKNIIKDYSEGFCTNNKKAYDAAMITKTFKNNVVKGDRTLSAYEIEASSLIGYMIIVILMGCTKSHDIDRKTGVFKRLVSTPIKKEGLFNINVLIYFVYSFCLGAVYILAFIVSGVAFTNVNLINWILILVGQSMFCAAVSGFCNVFFNKIYSQLILTLLLVVETILGGGFIPLKEVNNTIYLAMAKYSPLSFISSAYKNAIMFNSFQAISADLFIMIVVSTVFYLVSLVKVKTSWEE
ncbi:MULTISPECIES: ABC transporter permease [Clostridium]|uniref:ABC transporter permease n=1 Tax=Clostridium TaxID=1485 RepID=UPI000825B445|nr:MULTISPECIES: ABC transporter permease [Clostridium]PJI07463.1 ABC transporter permease [Clostridium sp. CT7]